MICIKKLISLKKRIVRVMYLFTEPPPPPNKEVNNKSHSNLRTVYKSLLISLFSRKNIYHNLF